MLNFFKNRSKLKTNGQTEPQTQVEGAVSQIENVVAIDANKSIVKGKLDHIDGSLARGWIAIIGEPQKKINLSVEVDGKEALVVVADKLRGDLRDAGINDGAHGFEINLEDLTSNQKGDFTIFLKSIDVNFKLMDSPLKVRGIIQSVKEFNSGQRLKLSREQQEIRSVITESEIFDASFYLKKNKDVRDKNVDALDHFVKNGDSEGRDPNLLFDTKYYKERYLKEGNANGLYHYIVSGALEGAKTSTGFDSGYYLQVNGDVKRAGLNPLSHYLHHGLREGRAPVRPKNVPQLSASSESGHVEIRTAGYLKNKPVCTIIVPVYNAPDETRACIESVIKHTDLSHNRVVIMDDCSPDPRVTEILSEFAGCSGITVHRNKENLGYTRNINRAISDNSETDILLLNSDTVVTADWLKKMQVAAYSDEFVGTVTAVSNNAGAFSVPQAGTNLIPDGISLDDMAALVSRSHKGEYPDVPTGNGFCFYIKKELFNDIGGFDEELFPRGYGEENDFCMRALRAGWRNIVDMKTYVYHVRTASFKNEKIKLIESSVNILRDKYPEYQALTKGIAASSVISAYRAKLADDLADVVDGRKAKPKPVIMYVLSTMTGGTPQTNMDLMSGVSHLYDTYVLACDRSTIKILKLDDGVYKEQEKYTLCDPILFWQHGSAEYRKLVSSILFDYDVSVLHIRHIAWHDYLLPKIAKKMGVPVIYSLHDFYTICPSVNLIDQNAVYHPRGAIENAANPLWSDDTCLPMNKDLHNLWQQRMQESLSWADVYITTSESAKEILQDNLPILKEKNDVFHVISHGRDFEKFENIDFDSTSKAYIDVLLPGNIGHSKGARLIREIKDSDAENKYRFHVLGKCTRDLDGYIVNHGEYLRKDFAERVREIKPDISAVLSIWPETYCHTLTESWAVGLPVLGVDLGAVGERIARRGCGWLAEPTADSIRSVLDFLINDRNQVSIRKNEILEWQRGYGAENTIKRMAESYLECYSELIS